MRRISMSAIGSFAFIPAKTTSHRRTWLTIGLWFACTAAAASHFQLEWIDNEQGVYLFDGGRYAEFMRSPLFSAIHQGIFALASIACGWLLAATLGLLTEKPARFQAANGLHWMLLRTTACFTAALASRIIYLDYLGIQGVPRSIMHFLESGLVPSTALVINALAIATIDRRDRLQLHYLCDAIFSALLAITAIGSWSPCCPPNFAALPSYWLMPATVIAGVVSACSAAAVWPSVKEDRVAIAICLLMPLIAAFQAACYFAYVA